MTDENSQESDESLDENAVADVDAALEETGAVEPDEPEDGEDGEESRVSGIAGKLMSMSGTGKDLDAYENDPIASVVDPSGEDEPTHRGAKHIARGVDGLSPVTAAHPLIDIAVGFVLISADERTNGAVLGGSDGEDGNQESARDQEDGGEMLT